jgi:hypothetical protein
VVCFHLFYLFVLFRFGSCEYFRHVQN